MSAQNVVRERVWWRVGNGSNIRIWGDKWLPSSTTYKVASPRQFLHHDTRVSELIDLNLASWKVDVLDALFLPYEAEVIKGIPISSRLPADKLIWAETSNGKFTVKSAYEVAMRLSKHEDQGVSSDQSNMRWFWKQIWNLPLAHKVCHFAWRACRDILPSKVNLMRRKVVNDQLCMECSLEAETTGHMFWTCPRAREVWACSKVVTRLNQERVQSFQDLLWYMLAEDRSAVDEVAKVVCIAWAMWHNRNETRHGGKRKSGAELVRWAYQYMEEYKAAAENVVCKTTVANGRRSWTSPPENVFKINVDGAVFANQKAVGVGVIIRDEKGRLEAALSKKILVPLGAVEAEAMAYEQGLMFARDIGIHNFIIEEDSLIIHQALCESATPPSSVAAVVQGMQEMCREFQGVMYSHVRRQGNQPAHLLAKYACGIVDFIAWVQETPCFLE